MASEHRNTTSSAPLHLHGETPYRRAVIMALRCHQSENQSDPFIAEHCGVGRELVRIVRSELTATVSCAEVTEKPRKSLDGKSRVPATKKRKEGQKKPGAGAQANHHDSRDEPKTERRADDEVASDDDESQRAMVAARIATMRQGARTDLAQICTKSRATAADLLNVAERSVSDARKVIDKGTPELAAAVDRSDGDVES